MSDAYERFPIPEKDRVWVFDKAGWKCQACQRVLRPAGPDQGHVDHIVPVSKGGPNNRSNYQALCRTCNQKKGDRTIDYRPEGRSTDYRTPRHLRRDTPEEVRANRVAAERRQRIATWSITLVLFVLASMVVGFDWFVLTAPASWLAAAWISEMYETSVRKTSARR